MVPPTETTIEAQSAALGLTFKSKIAIACAVVVVVAIIVGLTTHFVIKRKSKSVVEDGKLSEGGTLSWGMGEGERKRLFYVNRTAFFEGQEVPGTFINPTRSGVFYVQVVPDDKLITYDSSCVESYATLGDDKKTFCYDLSGKGETVDVKVPPLCTLGIPTLRSKVAVNVPFGKVTASSEDHKITISELNKEYNVTIPLTFSPDKTDWIVNQASSAGYEENGTILTQSIFSTSLDISKLPHSLTLTLILLAPVNVFGVTVNVLWYNGVTFRMTLQTVVEEAVLGTYGFYRLVTNNDMEISIYDRTTNAYIEHLPVPRIVFTDNDIKYARLEKTRELGILYCNIRTYVTDDVTPESVYFSNVVDGTFKNFSLRLLRRKTEPNTYAFVNTWGNTSTSVQTRVLGEYLGGAVTLLAKGTITNNIYDGDDGIIFRKIPID